MNVPTNIASRAHDRCADCAIRHRAVCSDCEESELLMLDEIKTYRTYRAGEEIVGMGEELGMLGSVVEGVVRLSKLTADGRRQMVGLLFPSDFIGRPGRSRALFDTVAATDVRLCLFERRRFEKLLGDIPTMEQRLLEMTLDELDAAREWMLLLGRKTAREKIASFIAMAARRSAALMRRAPDDGDVVPMPLSREEIGDFLGLTIETVSRQIGALKKEGVIVLHDARRIGVPDFEALLDAAGEDGDGGVIP